MTRSGAPGGSATRARTASASSRRCTPAASSAPAASTSARSITWLESTIWPCSRCDPGGTSSSPVDTTVTRGRRCTTTSATLAAAARARCPGPSRVPAASTTSPARTSSPRCRTERPTSGARCRATSAAPPSVSSTGTTASAPSGMGAPVMIRSTWPGRSTCRRVSPAAMSSATGSTTGAARVAPASSAARTAYPSIAELSKPGRSVVATTSRARTSPSADPTGTLCSGSGDTRASTVARCSASVRITRRPRGGRRRGWCARHR